MFSRKERRAPALQSAQTHLDEEWFFNYWNGIIREAEVDPADEGNRLELTLFTLQSLDNLAKGYMSQLGDSRSWATYGALMQDPQNCTATRKVSYIAGWNSQSLRLLEEKLKEYRELTVTAGQKFGYLRFFPSACHGERRIYPDGRPVCSACGRPADF